jgi:putative two-component system response regulator
VQTYLELDGYRNVHSTTQAATALSLVRALGPDLLLLDIHMPEMDGMEILKQLRAEAGIAMTPVVILTANSEDETKLTALECGATDLLSKPVHHGELMARIRNVLSVKAYQDELRRHSQTLEDAVRERTAELEASRLDVIHCLARAAEFRDDDTGAHIVRVGRYARLIGAQLGLPAADLENLEAAAQLHDVGKIGIPDAILLKSGKLTAEEYDVVQKHCGFGKKIVERLTDRDSQVVRGHAELGAKILETGRSPILETAKRIALTHHERWDGSGYPLGLSGEDIPLEGRITAVADVFDALSSKRSYKPAFPLAKCFEIMEDGRATHFDPDVLDAFFSCRHEIVQVQIALANTD